MKSTGVIRRIDELGRIVVPKEIRRNLGMRDGENIEIFTNEDSIILKKYNRMSTNYDLAKSLCDLINNLFNYKIIITDREKIIASSGILEEIINKSLTKELINHIENREVITKENEIFKINDLEIKENYIIVPIISMNDSIGLVIILSEHKITDEVSIGKLVANIFTRKLDI